MRACKQISRIPLGENEEEEEVVKREETISCDRDGLAGGDQARLRYMQLLRPKVSILCLRAYSSD